MAFRLQQNQRSDIRQAVFGLLFLEVNTHLIRFQELPHPNEQQRCYAELQPAINSAVLREIIPPFSGNIIHHM